MQIRNFIIPLLTLALGFGITRLGHSHGGSTPAVSSPAQTNSVSASPGAPPAGASPASTVHDHGRHPSEPSPGASGDRVVIPVKVASEILRKSVLGYSDFEDLKSSLGSAMTMLGIPEKDREQVQALAKQAEEDILREEKTRIKIASVEPASLTLDLSAMVEPAAEIGGRLRESFFAILPKDVAQTLADGINWDHYYPQDDTRQVIFTIARDPTGTLWAKMSGTRSSGVSIDESIYKDDGTPIPADRIFPDRWRPYLAGQTLVSSAHMPPQ